MASIYQYSELLTCIRATIYYYRVLVKNTLTTFDDAVPRAILKLNQPDLSHFKHP